MAKKKKSVSPQPSEEALGLALYEVLSPLRFDGDDYAIGETVEMSESQAAQALALAHLKPVAAQPPATGEGESQPPVEDESK